jgi:hypothetical protein
MGREGSILGSNDVSGTQDACYAVDYVLCRNGEQLSCTARMKGESIERNSALHRWAVEDDSVQRLIE